ncbi:histidine kinase [Dokdonia sp.]|uniref:sensor histidine kinase n=1 Tax=Dokdonia sp. TaxID=2024995 RepID=UPI0032638D51
MLELSPKTIHTIKNTFHVIFIGVITFELLRKASFLLPEDWLFFLTSDAIENFICACIAYGLYYFVFRLDHIWKKISMIILCIIILLLLASLKDYRIHGTTDFKQTFEYFTSSLGISLLFYSGIYFINRLEFLNRYKMLEKELNLAKAQLLKNQLHPHFLFNAFNSLYSLSLKNHPETSDYILKLSSMMRYLTDETHLTKVPLHKEIDFIEKYIAIERIRFGEDARITLTIKDSDYSSTFIAPFLLITLVENAFKHGFYTNSKDAFVNIYLNIKDNNLLCTVENSLFSKQHFQESNRDGKGLENLKQRLQLLYPKRSNMSITTTKESYTTQLKIPLSNEIV